MLTLAVTSSLPHQFVLDVIVGTTLGTKIEALRGKIKNIQQFLKLKKLYADGEVREALEKIQQMLESPGNNPIVRKGDLYAFIVAHYAESGQMR